MNQSTEIKQITEALIIVQSEIKKAELDGENPHFRAGYATLSSVIDACRPLLLANGIAVIQSPCAGTDKNGGAWLETKLIHKSGEWLSSTIFIPSSKNDGHGYGSAYTYARRYGLSAMVGIIQGDDDANETVATDKKTGLSINDKLTIIKKKINGELLEFLRTKFSGTESLYTFCEPKKWDENVIRQAAELLPDLVAK